MRPEALVFGMIAVLVFGLAGIVFLMMAMKMVGLNEGHILAFTVLSFLLMLGLEGTFIWQLFRRTRRVEERSQSKSRSTQELDAAQQRSLQEPLPSVTEHTTRAFDPIYRQGTSE